MGVERMVFVSASFPPFPATIPLRGYIEVRLRGGNRGLVGRWMRECVNVYIYLYICVYIYIVLFICKYIYTYIYIYIYI